ncbi:MAG: von Willebrand factor, type [Acidobacteriaceae bacterium]|nr:von Willebrand factor, type [Acidobacteriaceae bacterium]
MKHLPLVALLAASVCHAQTSSSVPKPPWARSSAPASSADNGSDIKVDVKLVNIFVTVTDEHGSPVGNLNKDNFQIFEDGHPQKISVFGKESELPLSIVLDIDTSLSTRKDLPLELASARRFAHAIIRPVDALSLYDFSEVVSQDVPFTADLKTIDHGIDRVHTGAATALYDAVFLGAQALETRQGRKVLVVITDGGDTVSQVNYHGALRAAQQAEAIVYSIIDVPIEASAGRDTGGEHALIQLSEDTGGKYYYASSITQLDQAFRAISDELRTQYLLAYYPSQRLADSDFRRLEVKLTGVPEASDYKARHRTGYYTSKSH